jgi:hypothetical protein
MRLNQHFQRMPLLKYRILRQLFVERLQTETEEVNIKLSEINAASRVQVTQVVH